MDDHDPTPGLAERIARLEALVRELARRIERPGAVTVGRLAVADEDGAERIVLDTVARTASVLVRVPGAAGATTGIELFATPPEDGEAATVGLCVLVDGDVVETWAPR
ncbi:MAG: hypothetical protein KF703_11490 [Actinobacteria bacterium]|nr:hypothetical protein [Actinomycetota bacterium]